MEALGNAWYGSWRPLTNLTQTFQVCHLCTFNVATIFFQGNHYIWHTTVRHNKQTMLGHAVPCQLLCSGYAPGFSSVLRQLQFQPCSLVTQWLGKWKTLKYGNQSMKTKVWKHKYEVRKKAAYGCLVPYCPRFCLVAKGWLSLDNVRAGYWHIGLQQALTQSIGMTQCVLY